MQVTQTKNEGLSREFTVVIPAADFEAKIDGRLQEIAKTAAMPGFRPGKVPVSLLKQKYGQSVMGEALEQAVNDAATKVIADNDLKPAMQPKIEIVKFEEGQDIECSMGIEVLPDFEVGDFAKIKLTRLVTETDEKEVDGTLDRMATAYKSSEPVAKARKAKSGDVAVIDFVGSIDGEEFPGGKAEDYPLELGTGNFIPGFEEQLIGAMPGDGVEVKVTFPAEYGAEDLAGKDAVFACKIKELQESKPADIDDELAKKAGMESLDALKQAIRDQHDVGFKDISRQKLKRALLDALDKEYGFELPPGMIQAEIDAIRGQFEEAMKAGQEADDMSDDERDADFAEIASRRVKLGLLLAKIGRDNKIEVTQDDINKMLTIEAQRYPGQEQMVFDYYKNNPEAMQALGGPAFEDKVVDHMLEQVKLTDKTVTAEELMAEDEEPAPKKKAKKAAPKKAADNKAPAKKAPAKKAPAKKKD